jgi:mono/diheme cytochrome c family protein
MSSKTAHQGPFTWWNGNTRGPKLSFLWLVAIGACLCTGSWPGIGMIFALGGERPDHVDPILITQDTQDELPATVRGILSDRCIDCHGQETAESGLRLDSSVDLSRGGDFGPVVAAGDPENSELIRRVVSQGADRMPPDGDSLTREQIEILSQWIESGAVGLATVHGGPPDTDERWQHWAWQPLAGPVVPEVVQESQDPSALRWESARNEIDHFVRAKLAASDLSPSPPADRVTLIRRLYFDLHGLPPSPESIDAFVADADPKAYERLVDQLLESPRYGERWARHWLDVVHYGDTHGYDKDQPRNHAWPYRDYVIRAFNEDKPYHRFIEEQIAGDALYPGTRDGQEALGFVAAGPWDLIGHREVPETKTDGKIARHLDRDDMVANTIGTFNSVTVQCAQCHHHKFDPITQEDYYSLQAVFAAVDRDDREYFIDESVQAQRVALESKAAELKQKSQDLKATLQRLGGEKLKSMDESLAKLNGQASAAQGGYHSQLESTAELTKWLQLDLGETSTITEVVIHPCYDDFQGIGAGFSYPVRYRIELSEDASFQTSSQLLFDGTSEDIPNPGIAVQRHRGAATGRYLRMTVTRLAHRSNDYCFAIAEIECFDASGINLATGAEVTALDSIEAPDRWTKANAVDGRSPAAAIAVGESIRQDRAKWLDELGLSDLSEQLQETEAALRSTNEARDRLGPVGRVYAATTHLRQGMPRPIHVLSRGNVLNPRQLVAPGTLGLLKSLPARFDLPDDHSEADRRVALARWISHPDNPLTWRSIVNRVWHYHFGQGIVATPGDFGIMGSAPSHPELLDWLALWFREHNGSLKALHRLIVCSATYRQSSFPRPEAMQLDATNVWMWRATPRRLEAEAIRDAVLQVAGTLDVSMGGPGWQDFVVQHPEHSPHYRYDLADPTDRKTWRRSIYRFIVRSQTQPLMTVLDCADPSMRVERRNQSMSPLQALALLNNGFMLVQAEEFATRVRRDAGQDVRAQVERAFRLACGRWPDAEESNVLVALTESEGLENTCRALFNLNEFVWID